VTSAADATSVPSADAPGPMVDPEGRKRPQFGEYATPEEQRASIQVPFDEAHPEPVPIPVTRSAPPTPSTPVENPRPYSAAPARGPAGATTRSGDRLATIALLAIGLINVVTTVPGLFHLSDTLDQTFKQMDIGSFTATPVAAGVGIGLAVFYVLAWLATLALSLRRMRSGRISFWIPLVAGVVVTIVAMICFLALFFGDPSFMDYVTRSTL
jgi:uncharacterized membrane protein YhaH (DUF805 family)